MAAAFFGGPCNDGGEDNLNAIAVEHTYLGTFSDRKGTGKRNRITIGIIGSLSSYGYLPLWHTLLSELGYSVRVPDLKRLDAFTAQAGDTITSEKLCTPAKSAHGRIFEMIDRGIDALFAPRYRSASLCTVLCNYSQVIKHNIPAVANGTVGLIDPALEDVKLRYFYEKPEKFAPALEAIRAFDNATAPTDREFDEALARALEIQRRFDEDNASLHRKTVEQVFHSKEKRAVIIAARPYQLAVDQLKGIDRRFNARGYTVLSPLAIRTTLGQMPWTAEEDPTRNHDALLHYIAEGAIDEPAMNVVFLQSAHCGYDAVSIAEARQLLIEGGRRCAVIGLDGPPEQIDSQINAALKDFQEERTRRYLEASETLDPSQAIEFLMDSYRDESLRLDAQKQFSNIPDSLCNTVSALFRDSFDSFSDDPDLTEVRLPAVCKGCLVEMLPSLLSRNLDREVKVIWDDHWIEAPEIVGIGYGQLSGFDTSESHSAGSSAAPTPQGRNPPWAWQAMRFYASTVPSWPCWRILSSRTAVGSSPQTR